MSSKNARDLIFSRKKKLKEDIDFENKSLHEIYVKYGLTQDLIGQEEVKNIEEDVQLIENKMGEIEIREPYVEEPKPKKTKK